MPLCDIHDMLARHGFLRATCVCRLGFECEHHELPLARTQLALRMCNPEDDRTEWRGIVTAPCGEPISPFSCHLPTCAGICGGTSDQTSDTFYGNVPDRNYDTWAYVEFRQRGDHSGQV